MITDLVIPQGETFEQAYSFQDDDGNPVDFTGSEIAAEVRRTSSGGLLLGTFSYQFFDNDPEQGGFILSMDPFVTGAIQCDGVYSIVRVVGRNRYRLLEGRAVLDRSKTASPASPTSRKTWGLYHYTYTTWRELSAYRWREL